MTRFYASGLKFSCKRCSSCCRYESGYVFLTKKDIEKLLVEIKMDRNSFIRTYCRWVTGINGKEELSLKEKSNKDCIFWDSGCYVYYSRPLQCRTFPFWESILSTPKAWETAATDCPGMNCGAFYTKEKIKKFVKMRICEPVIFKKQWSL
jgi:Fe-S-cluster containining protein